MTDLCIAIVFHNATEKYVVPLLTQIKQNVKIDGTYKVILFDNRERKLNYSRVYNLAKEVFPDIQICYEKKLVFHKNWKQFEARRYIVDNICDCKYIWFVDSDDEVLQFGYNIKEEDSDIIVFSNICNSKGDNKVFDDRSMDKFLSKDTLRNYNVVLWNKWIKLEVFKSIIDKIPAGIEMVGGEDVLYNLLLLESAKTIKTSSKIVYKYNNRFDSRSQCGTYKDLKRSLIGQNTFLSMCKNLLKEDTLLSLEYSPKAFNCVYYINIAACIKDSQKLKSYRLIKKIFGGDYIDKLLSSRDYAFYLLPAKKEYINKVFRNFENIDIDDIISKNIEDIVENKHSLKEIMSKYEEK